jgi:hypothetical protein
VEKLDPFTINASAKKEANSFTGRGVLWTLVKGKNYLLKV